MFLKRLVDILILLIVCYLVFIGYLDDHRFIKTEGLRALVVKEMLERDGLTMPTVHYEPYLNKPPLHAWCTTWLARQFGYFNEKVARLPSAVAGAALVLLMYVLSECWIGRGAGLVAATFTLYCPTIADYAVRAELDMPFSLFCALNIVCTFAALRAKGVRAGLMWLSAYAFALAAAMWKGPHSLIFMWMTLIGWSVIHLDRSRPRRLGSLLRGELSWLVSPGQVLGLFLCLMVLVKWAQALSAFAGPGRVSRMAAIEALDRLIPHKAVHLLEMVVFIPFLAIIAVPASVFAVLTFSRRLRLALWGEHPAEVIGKTVWGRGWSLRRGWGAWMCRSVRRRALLAWLLPSLLFMLWAPAKSPRYTIPIFPPIILLGAMVAIRLEEDPAQDGCAPRMATRVWRAFFTLLTLAGLAGVVGLVLALLKVDVGGLTRTWRPWAFLAIGGALPLAVELLQPARRSLNTRVILSLVALLAIQPVLRDIWWPLRVAGEPSVELVEQIDDAVPNGQYLYVLGVHEYHDLAIYADTPFVFAYSLDDVLARARDIEPATDRAYAIFRTDETDELTANAQSKYEVLFHFERQDRDNVLVEIMPAGG
jgi:4-amino-4-deoxy-L-arabinose transferase-like glycosyltransferase